MKVALSGQPGTAPRRPTGAGSARASSVVRRARAAAVGAGQPCEFSEPGRFFSHGDQSRGSSESGSLCDNSRAAQIGQCVLAPAGVLRFQPERCFRPGYFA